MSRLVEAIVGTLFLMLGIAAAVAALIVCGSLIGCESKSRVTDGPAPCQHPVFHIPESTGPYCLDGKEN